MDKFSRNYFLSIQKNRPGIPFVNAGNAASSDFITIQPPFTIEFDINRHSLGSVNYAQIKIYNLSKANSNAILKNWNDFNNLKLVRFQAGYGPGPNLPLLFTGNASQVQSVRVGNNYITTIEAYDGGFAFSNGWTSRIIEEDIVRSDLIRQLMETLTPYGLSPGAIGNSFNDVISRGTSYSGNPIDIIKSLTNGQMFVDQGRINCISKENGEVIYTPNIPVINSASGLLGTPVREQTYLNFDSLFEPTLLVGQQIKLESVNNQNYNQNYSIVQLRHRGMISPAVCGEAVTSIGVFSTRLTPIPVQVSR